MPCPAVGQSRSVSTPPRARVALVRLHGRQRLPPAQIPHEVGGRARLQPAIPQDHEERPSDSRFEGDALGPRMRSGRKLASRSSHPHRQRRASAMTFCRFRKTLPGGEPTRPCCSMRTQRPPPLTDGFAGTPSLHAAHRRPTAALEFVKSGANSVSIRPRVQPRRSHRCPRRRRHSSDLQGFQSG